MILIIINTANITPLHRSRKYDMPCCCCWIDYRSRARNEK